MLCAVMILLHKLFFPVVKTIILNNFFLVKDYLLGMVSDISY